MIQRRGVLVPVVLAGFVALAVLLPRTSVQAREMSGPGAPARTAFDVPNLAAEYRSTLQAVPADPMNTGLPEGKGRDLTEKKCNMCHASTLWTKKHYSEDKWASVIDSMAEKGMVASDEEVATITSYLTANFGPIKTEAPATPPPAK